MVKAKAKKKGKKKGKKTRTTKAERKSYEKDLASAVKQVKHKQMLLNRLENSRKALKKMWGMGMADYQDMGPPPSSMMYAPQPPMVAAYNYDPNRPGFANIPDGMPGAGRAKVNRFMRDAWRATKDELKRTKFLSGQLAPKLIKMGRKFVPKGWKKIFDSAVSMPMNQLQMHGYGAGGEVGRAFGLAAHKTRFTT